MLRRQSRHWPSIGFSSISLLCVLPHTHTHTKCFHLNANHPSIHSFICSIYTYISMLFCHDDASLYTVYICIMHNVYICIYYFELRCVQSYQKILLHFQTVYLLNWIPLNRKWSEPFAFFWSLMLNAVRHLVPYWTHSSRHRQGIRRIVFVIKFEVFLENILRTLRTLDAQIQFQLWQMQNWKKNCSVCQIWNAVCHWLNTRMACGRCNHTHKQWKLENINHWWQLCLSRKNV